MKTFDIRFNAPSSFSNIVFSFVFIMALIACFSVKTVGANDVVTNYWYKNTLFHDFHLAGTSTDKTDFFVRTSSYTDIIQYDICHENMNNIGVWDKINLHLDGGVTYTVTVLEMYKEWGTVCVVAEEKGYSTPLIKDLMNKNKMLIEFPNGLSDVMSLKGSKKAISFALMNGDHK